MDASISAEKCRGNENLQASSSAGTKEVTEPLLATHVEDEFEELSEEIPDPFSDDEGDIIELSNETFLQQPIGMVTSITSMVNTILRRKRFRISNFEVFCKGFMKCCCRHRSRFIKGSTW